MFRFKYKKMFFKVEDIMLLLKQQEIINSKQ